MINTYDVTTFNRKLGNIKRNTASIRENVGDLWLHAMAYAAGLHGNANSDFLAKLINTVVGTNVGGVALTTQIKLASKQVLPYLTFGKDQKTKAFTVKAKGWSKMEASDRIEAIQNMRPLFDYEAEENVNTSPYDVAKAIAALVKRVDAKDQEVGLTDRALFHRLRELIGEDISKTTADQTLPKVAEPIAA